MTVSAMSEIATRLTQTLRKPVVVDEFTMRQRMARAQEADLLQKNEAFIAALSEIEAFYLDAWRRSTLEAVELRERAHIAVSLLDDIRNSILSRVRDGEVARETLKKSLRQSI